MQPRLCLTAAFLTLLAGSARAQFTFDLIVPGQFEVETDFATGVSAESSWLVVTSGTLPNADLAASTFSLTPRDPSLVNAAEVTSLLNVPFLGDLGPGDVAGASSLGYSLEPGESLVDGSSFSGLRFRWQVGTVGNTVLDGTWTIADQIVEFSIPVSFVPGSSLDVVTRSGQQRFSSRPVPEPTACVLVLTAISVCLRRRSGSRGTIRRMSHP
ncbi:MAG: hypothetical protein AAFV43_07680 [Planctomycetota bacterium]